ncbi:hypothetical protein CUU66_23335 [Peribacillus deserti]|uniref:Uncharacterized protein n=1 Tax=Peribacillus deserti TaxID=673318 RepID=A0A2N5LZK5_9BACI|nr:hypothetical protein CUU66_23335 [Peribacillus deserti]
MERKVRDSCGSSGTGETPQAKLRRLSARPAESEHPVVEITPCSITTKFAKTAKNNTKFIKNSLRFKSSTIHVKPV